MGTRSRLALLLAVPLLASACTITSVGGAKGPPRVESDGLIEGHAAFGIRDEHRFLKLRVFDGESDGAVGEFVLWKLFRLEVGALGLGVGIGPFDFALGTLFYEPEVPEMIGEKEAREAAATAAPVEECELCREARERGETH